MQSIYVQYCFQILPNQIISPVDPDTFSLSDQWSVELLFNMILKTQLPLKMLMLETSWGIGFAWTHPHAWSPQRPLPSRAEVGKGEASAEPMLRRLAWCWNPRWIQKNKKDGSIHKYKVVQPENDGSMPVEYQMHIPVQLLRTPNPSLTHKHPTTRTWGTSQSSSAQKAH